MAKQFLHEKSNVEGDVDLGENVSVWAFASIRGDEGKIIIGDNSNVQDGAIIHGAVSIGKNVTIGHNAVIHGAKIGNNVLIGISSVILDGVEIGDWSIVAAGSVVVPNSKIEGGSVVMGLPGKVARLVNENDKKYIQSACQNYLDKIKDY
ncbi:MAG TPA: gamma carbonic anhydrase family protein [Candidatus Pacearchaeota archaeon]|jgi:carbonic anhydrase/acetyltransferase-like protein (isoleucine patch superfamily)|nr:MAG: gamma carbonic anhydrase family protein [Candidatus Yanofskybacteria bacterium]HNR81159.1 gamma carbonic anhydrase family protein [Candidatus Pacearchaeota archaeon]HPO06493.1 gamma carbonic anhydrase family protein [Candidatus Pacearchaeota archaeon]